MKKWIEVLWLIFKREIFPASDGTGWKQIIFYQFPVFYLPVVGIALLLILVSYSGLCLVGVEQGLSQRLSLFKTSPFTALFAKGYFYLPEKGNDRQDNYANLASWMDIPIQDVLTSEQIPALVGESTLFSSVKPFSWIYLDIERRDGEHLAFQQGMGLPLSGDHVDTPLVDEIQTRLYQGYVPEIALQGIIVSAEGMKRFGWYRREDYPEFLWVRLSSNDPQNTEQYIPFRLSVVDKLPYQFHYLLPMEEVVRLENRYYYDSVDLFDVQFFQSNSETTLKEIEKILPAGTRISAFLKGGKETLRILLSEESSRINILESFAKAGLLTKEMKFFFGNFDTAFYVEGYKGAIFHLNFELPNKFTWSKELIYTIQNFMDRKGITVEGEVIELLSEMLATQENLKNLQTFFGIGLWLILLILIFFFAVVLHTRMHRIGTTRMFGYPDLVIASAYSLVGFGLVIVTFIIASILLIYIYQPIDMSISLYDLTVINLFFKILCITEIGFLAPVIYYLHSFQPAEMMTFRS